MFRRRAFSGTLKQTLRRHSRLLLLYILDLGVGDI